MVELVDTRDLKSLDHCDRAGSSPAPGTIQIADNRKTDNGIDSVFCYPSSVIRNGDIAKWLRQEPAKL